MAITDSQNCTCSDVTNNRTLKSLRDDLMRRLGWGATVNNPPPGVADMLNSFLVESQELLYRRYKVLRTERFYSWPLTQGVRLYDLPDNEESLTVPAPVNAAFSTSGVGGSLAAGTYYYRVSAVNAFGESLASTGTSQVTVGATSTVTVNWIAPTAPNAETAVTGYRIYGRTTGAELLLANVGLVTTWIDDGSLTPAGALPTVNTTAICGKSLDARMITWVGMERDDSWVPLHCGIRPELYSYNQTGWPQRYEIRQCVEVWPTPDFTAGNLIIRGHFGLESFSADTDRVTIDDRAVFLLALANAKAHYRQSDAGNYVQQLEAYLDNMVAGAHLTRRYIPGDTGIGDGVYVIPRPTVPFPT